MKETEITVQVFNKLNEIDKILKAQGFEMVENYQLNDWYFSKLENIEGLDYQYLLNNSFLVRQVISDQESIKLCYKKKELDSQGNVIAEEKIQTKIDSLNNAINIFKAAGLNNYCMVKDNSFVYKNGATSFVVQDVEGLGTFIEYEEDETMRGMSSVEKIDRLTKTINALGLILGKDNSCKKVFMLLNRQR